MLQQKNSVIYNLKAERPMQARQVLRQRQDGKSPIISGQWLTQKSFPQLEIIGPALYG